MPKFFKLKISLRVWHILLFFALTVVYEFILTATQFSVRDFIITWLGPSVIIACIIDIAAALIGNMSNLEQLKKIVNNINKFITGKLQVATIWGALALILVLIIGPAHAAYLHPAGWVINTLGSGASDADNKASAPPVTASQEKELPESDPPESNSPQTTPSPEETDFWDGILMVPDVEHILESDSQLYLEIFFQTGDSPLTDWTADGVYAYVCTEVETRRLQNLDPKFDEEGIPQPIKDEISRASDLDDIAHTWEQQKDVIDTRLWAYSQYQEYSLVTLIREDYCTCGDAYVTRRLSKNTAVYYFAHSIRWGLNALSYGVSPGAASYDLSQLAERYQKIADNTSSNSDDPDVKAIHDRAQLLANAFKSVSVDYSKKASSSDLS